MIIYKDTLNEPIRKFTKTGHSVGSHVLHVNFVAPEFIRVMSWTSTGEPDCDRLLNYQ